MIRNFLASLGLDIRVPRHRGPVTLATFFA